jgi:LAS superfamily LD-carboxypeptidase LdcB/putative cell wall-binding protein
MAAENEGGRTMRKSTTVIAIMAALALLLGPLPAQASSSPAPSGVSRWSGIDRFATSTDISRHVFAGPADAVFVANGLDFPDALAGGPIAALEGAPLLLVSAKAIPATVATELERLDPHTIYILGGEGVISTAVESRLGDYAESVERISGQDRYGTAVAVSQQGWNTSSTTFITSGAIFADALSGGAAAAHLEAPLLLTTPTGLLETVASELARLAPARVYLLGGTGVLSDAVEAQVRAAVPAAEVHRLAGVDRYATSAAIVDAVWPTGADTMMFTTGTGFADALSGTPAAHASDAPIVLQRPNCTPTVINALKAKFSPTSTVLLGGTGVVAEFSSDLDCSVVDARSINIPSSLWVVANKLRPLNPVTYVPPDLVNAPVAHVNSPLLRAEAASQLAAMFARASAEGAGALRLQSAYRSYSAQVGIYANYVRTRGQAWADLQSARAGFSEHQTGLAVDISAGSSCILLACFANTTPGIWLANNSYRFGFVLRYPQGMTNITGYDFEPWHFRYVGLELATLMHDKGVKTLEEIFGLPYAPDYAH